MEPGRLDVTNEHRLRFVVPTLRKPRSVGQPPSLRRKSGPAPRNTIVPSFATPVRDSTHSRAGGPVGLEVDAKEVKPNLEQLHCFWRVAQACDLPAITNKVGAPSLRTLQGWEAMLPVPLDL